MKPSALLLRHYFVSELSVTANRAFDAKKKVELKLVDVVADPECQVDKKNDREWQLVLRVKHTQSAESNSPYFFMVELVGFFGVNKAVKDEEVGRFVEVNGASVLFSTAREVLRSAMAMGPYRPIVLPTVCFFEAKGKAGAKKLVDGGAAGSLPDVAKGPSRRKKAEVKA